MSDRFVKSANTGVPVSRSQVELERVLRRYGCTGFAVSNDYTEMYCAVTIRVPDGPEKDAAQIPVVSRVPTAERGSVVRVVAGRLSPPLRAWTGTADGRPACGLPVARYGMSERAVASAAGIVPNPTV